MKRLNFAILTSLLLMALMGCGKGGQVTVSSDGASDATQAFARTVAPANPITEFKLCVRSIKLIQPDGSAAVPQGASSDDDDKDAIKFAPGLVDAVSATSWGTFALKSEITVEELRIKIHQDDSLCQGLGGSMKINGMVIHPDIEFKFKLSPAVSLAAGNENLKVSFAAVVSAIEDAYTAIQGDPDSIKSVIEGVDGSALESHE
jgi:hypothetical protein